jgi:hypothetical protein
VNSCNSTFPKWARRDPRAWVGAAHLVADEAVVGVERAQLGPDGRVARPAGALVVELHTAHALLHLRIAGVEVLLAGQVVHNLQKTGPGYP